MTDRKPWAGSTGRQRTRTAQWRTTAAQVRARDHDACRACGNPGRQVDHIVPHSAGGSDDPSNLQTLCDSCHDRKTIEDRAKLAAKAKRPKERHPGLK